MSKKDRVVLILTDKNKKAKNGLFETSAAIKEYLDGQGITNFTLFTRDALLTNNKDGTITAKNPGLNEITFNPAYASASMRKSAINTKHGEDIIEELEERGVFVVNTLHSSKLVNDKHKFAKALIRKEVSTPATKLLPGLGALDQVLDNFNFPAVFKSLKGSRGIGVFKIDNRESAKGILQAIWDRGGDILIQELIKNNGDVRTIVIGGKIIGAMKRISKGEDFRNNVSQGATVEPYKLNSQEKIEILKAAKTSGCNICGVDHILSDTGKVYVLEVNASPGTGGFKLVDKDIAAKMGKYIASKYNERTTESVLGYKENIEILNIGTFVSKLDTGNGRYSVLHGDNLKINNKKVIFDIEGKTFEYPLEQIAKVQVGAVSSVTVERPVIKLDIKLNGKTLKNEPFFITDRSDKKTPALLSRALLHRAKAVIDSTRKHILDESTKHSAKPRPVKAETPAIKELYEICGVDNIVTNASKVYILESKSTGPKEFKEVDDDMVFKIAKHIAKKLGYEDDSKFNELATEILKKMLKIEEFATGAVSAGVTGAPTGGSGMGVHATRIGTVKKRKKKKLIFKEYVKFYG